MRLIDADALKDRFKLRINWLKKDVHDQYSLGLFHGSEYDAKLIDEIPTIEAKPLRYGRWELEIEKRPDLYGWVPLNSVVCSLCNKSNETKKPYCPNCGAKMDLKGEW